VDTGRRDIRERFSERGAAFDRSLQQSVQQSGAELIRLETGRSYAEPLLAFFRRRERAQRH
jgi:hypothetical protein